MRAHSPPPQCDLFVPISCDKQLTLWVPGAHNHIFSVFPALLPLWFVARVHSVPDEQGPIGRPSSYVLTIGTETSSGPVHTNTKTISIESSHDGVLSEVN